MSSRKKTTRKNPTLKHVIDLPDENLEVLKSIREKMVNPGHEVSVDQIAAKLKNSNGKPGVTASYLYRILARKEYASLDRMNEILGVVEEIQSEMEDAA